MTEGVFEVAGIYDNTLDREKVLEYAALAESSSSHPISRSLQKAYGKDIDRTRVTDVEEISAQRNHRKGRWRICSGRKL